MEAIYSNILEINPQEVFWHMKENIYNNYSNEKKLNIDKDYFKIRTELISIIHKISKKMGFKSQTFFLSIYYLDIILLQNKIKINNLHLLGLSCFIVATKYCENDPIVPPLENFLNFYNKYNSNMNKKIKLEELFEMEVRILKYLNYNLHYVTIYDFNLFFFNHGIIKKQQIKDIINNNVNFNNNNKNNKSDISSNEEDNDFILDGNYIKKILEKIYKKSRYYLDLIIINEKICFKYNALLLSVYIMKKSIEEIILNEFKIKNKDYYLNKRQIIKKTNLYFKEVMKNFYKIDYEKDKKYQELIKDKEIINIFPLQEKINELKTKKYNNVKKNILNFKKVFPSNKKSFNENNNFIRKNNIIKNGINNIRIGISNLATSSTIEESQSPNIILNSFILKNQNNLSQNNSKEKIKNNKANNTLFENYNNNKILYTKNLLNGKKYLNNNDNNNNSNIDINKKIAVNNNSNFNSYIEKSTTNCTFTQLKNNLKKNFSLNKKRCKDRYSYINNLKSLCKLTSCSNTIKNIKEGSFIQNNIVKENHSPLPDKNLLKDTEGEINRINSFIDKSSNSLYLIKNLRVKNVQNYFSKDKINNKNSLNLFEKDNIKDELNEININNSYDKSFQDNKSNKSKKKEKEEQEKKGEKEIKGINLIRLKYRTNTLNENKNINNNDTNRKKPYFKKVIHNFDPMKRKTINKNDIKINISNILNKSNYNNINNGNNYKTTTNNNNYISLSNYYNQNSDNKKIELIRKRIISINKRNANLDLLINKSNDSNGTKLIKDLNNAKNENNLNDDNSIIQNSKSINLSHNKITNIPKNLKISTNFYEKKNNIRYEMNESPILFSKEIKALNINNDNNLYHNNDLNLKIRETSSTIENTSSYHKKKIINSLNKIKIMNSFAKIKTTNDEKDSNYLNNNSNSKKIEGNSFYKKYKNVFIINSINSDKNNFTNKKFINNALNNYNTINSTKNNIKNENGHL